jgi:hypothetical protein
LILLFLSYTTDGFKLLEKPDHVKLGFVAVVFLLSITIPLNSRSSYMNVLSASVIILAVIHLFFVEPKKLSPENIAVKETADYIDSMPGKKDKQKLTNHIFIQFYASSYKENPSLFKNLNSKSINEAPSGSLVIWESHYGYRPEFRGYDNLPYDVQLESIEHNSSFKMLKEIVSSDKRFAAFVFEKL